VACENYRQSTMRTAAILPVKRFSGAKQRLGESVGDPLRRDLARAMVGDVLSALRDCAALERTIVVTCEESVAAAARYLGALVVPDTAEAGQSAAVAVGIERAVAEGFARVLCIPGDCPALDPGEVAALLGAADARDRGSAEVVIVPDRHGTGTNGLLLTPPGAIEPSFGPGSCARHLQLAREAGVATRVEQVPSLLLDIDTGADLAALRELVETGTHAKGACHPDSVAGEPRAGARRTRKVLAPPRRVRPGG
jgi:2-phospho-L-lactate guanylyltransferase